MPDALTPEAPTQVMTMRSNARRGFAVLSSIFAFAALQIGDLSVLRILRLDYGLLNSIPAAIAANGLIAVGFGWLIRSTLILRSASYDKTLETIERTSSSGPSKEAPNVPEDTRPSTLREATETENTEPDKPRQNSEPYWLVSENLNKRVVQLQVRATAIYWTMLIIIVSGVFLAIFSNYLSSFDNYGNSMLSIVESEKASYSSDTQVMLDQKGKILDALISKMQDSSKTDHNLGGPGTILRIVIVSLVIFLVQILMQLYRYNSRLIAFYGSRRDALLLAQGDPKQGQTFANLLAPAGLDFGKEPSHPLLEAGRLIFGRKKGSAEEADQQGDTSPDGRPTQSKVTAQKARRPERRKRAAKSSSDASSSTSR
jgi:hypothetical protein